MHRLADDNEDNAPFQIDYLDLGYEPNSYSAYQPLTRAPCWLEIPPLLWLQALGLFRDRLRLILSHIGPPGVRLRTYLRCH